MYRVAIVGVGRGGEGIGAHSIGYQHARSYNMQGNCRIVCAADLNEENLSRFAQAFDVPTTSRDYRRMLAQARPEIVSVATYVGSHREIVEACVESGVKGIWCEKPFCLTMDDGRAMVDLCERSGVRLVVDHQRRFLHTFTEARRLLQAGMIGEPLIILATVGEWDIMEWGVHWFDMMRFLSGDRPVAWVLGQVRCTGEKQAYCHLLEEHAVAYVGFQDGLRGVLEGGVPMKGGFAIRVTGTDGLLDMNWDGGLRLLNGQGWQDVPTRSSLHGPDPGYESEDGWLAALQTLLSWVEGGPEPEVSGRNGLKSSALYLAAYESARRGDRVDLPLVEQSEFPLDAIARGDRARPYEPV